MRRRQSIRRAFMLIDTIGGLLLLLTTILLLTSITTRGRVVAKRLAADRAATRLAETTLLTLAADPAASIPDAVEVRSADDATSGKWVFVTATVEGRQATIAGVVPHAIATTQEAR